MAAMTDTFVAAALKELELTQTALAAKIGVAQGDVSKWANGHHKPSRAARAAIERLLEERRREAA